MLTRFIVVVVVAVALISGTGVVMADSPDESPACDGVPSNGLIQSVSASEGTSLNAAEGVGTAFDQVGCDVELGELLGELEDPQ